MSNLKETPMRVLVTGGAGYIGSHATRALRKAGHDVIVVDNLARGHQESLSDQIEFELCDLQNIAHLDLVFEKHEPEAVMHFAASIEVAESVARPLDYYQNNFVSSLNLLECMRQHHVTKLVFSSTAAVYGQPSSVPIVEDHERRPINPYGRSKMMIELAIEDSALAWGLKACIFRYFNVAGAAEDSQIGEAHEPESHLIPRLLLSLLHRQNGEAEIFGTDYPTPDGTCVRDFVHVLDLVDAHVLGLTYLQSQTGVEVFNLGSERGYSVREVVEQCRKVTGRPLMAIEKGRRPGDPAVLLASRQRALSRLGWEPRYSTLEKMIEDAWNWHRLHPHGYRSSHVLDEPARPSRDR